MTERFSVHWQSRDERLHLPREPDVKINFLDWAKWDGAGLSANRILPIAACVSDRSHGMNNPRLPYVSLAGFALHVLPI